MVPVTVMLSINRKPLEDRFSVRLFSETAGISKEVTLVPPTIRFEELPPSNVPDDLVREPFSVNV